MMIGYKIAIACDKVKGPFFVVVTIDTLDSVIRTCGDKSRCEYAIVKDIAPYCWFDFPESDEKYRKMTAYSIYELATYYNTMVARAMEGDLMIRKLRAKEIYTDLIKTRYKVGDRVSCDYFMDRNIECAPGIHFFTSYNKLVSWVDDYRALCFNGSFSRRVLSGLQDIWNSFNQYSPNGVKALFDEISGDYEL
jgi:hypothetical protein